MSAVLHQQDPRSAAASGTGGKVAGVQRGGAGECGGDEWGRGGFDEGGGGGGGGGDEDERREGGGDG